MKAVPLLILFCASLISGFSQGIVDSLRHKTILNKPVTTIDSLSLRFENSPDSLLPLYSKIDSIQHDFKLKADSLSSKYQNALSKIEWQRSRLSQNVDSIRSLNLPAQRYTRKLDSLNQAGRTMILKYTTKLDSLKSDLKGKLNALDVPPEYRERLQKLTQSVDKLSLNGNVADIPGVKIPGYQLPSLNGVNGIPEIPSLDGIENPAALGNLPNIETPAGELGNVAQPLQGYQEKIQEVTGGDITSADKLPEAIESQASKIDGIEELQKQSGVIDAQKSKLDDLNDPDKAKAKAVDMAKKAAVDHFAGKQEQLKAAMEKISKYKQKYSSVSSIKDLPKRPPNPMKGKPFIERLIPGLYFQYQQKNFYLIDVNPYVAYKLTGRFNTGLGWNHRLAWDSKRDRWNQRAVIFGPRAFVDFKLGKGFIAHVEGESMNTFVPSAIHGNPDT
ncbi:MAG: hypothetical protein M3Y60_07930, partial [Bacteroidota bacterium]|nr:hypothetical protein [Bacteroidota bacterium]